MSSEIAKTEASPWSRLLGIPLRYPPIVWVMTALLILGGLVVAPFDPTDGAIPRSPIAVDAIPDIGENQQIIFTEWAGRSPRDVEDQVTYPLTTALLGIPGVETIRSTSALGFSSIYIIFEDDAEFYWSRSRVLEKLASLPPGTVPDGVTPTLGPDATALGQVFWYTLEGQAPDGKTVGGWDADELRSIQDWTVRYALQSVEGVSEVASVGGFVREYQVDVDPEAMRAHGVTIAEVANAVRGTNLDISARTLEVNGVEYVVRGLGLIETVEDLEQAVVDARDFTPVRVKDVANVALGPALRRGALDDEGAPAVGGVVVARYLQNPAEVLGRVKAKIEALQPGLPKRVLDDGTVSQVTLVPFYDRSTLIEETLGTLSTALYRQVLITILVVLVMLRNVRSSALISAMLPLTVLGTFLVMRWSGVDANIMALGGIAIAIGSMVDIGIVFVENMLQTVQRNPHVPRTQAIRDGAAEVAPAVLTSVMTTVVSFLPLLGLTSREVKLFGPLIWTKSYTMLVALGLAMVILPVAAATLYRARPHALSPRARSAVMVGLGLLAFVLLVRDWQPLGAGSGWLVNGLVTAAGLAAVLGGVTAVERRYSALLDWAIDNRRRAVWAPILVVAFGWTAAVGITPLTSVLPDTLRQASPIAAAERLLPGLGREYMPSFDEGAFLYMPTTMPHASIGESLDLMSRMDAAIADVPEVDRVVGKLGRAESALDPAPVSMIETVITYHPEWTTGADGERVRLWRDHIHSPDDIWKEITTAATLPGLTGAPTLMPIEARLVMLQSGMRAPLGVKIQGPTLEAIESFGLAVEETLREVPGVRAETVFADRVVGKPYLEIDLDREALARFGLRIQDVQNVLQVALGGQTLTRSIEGRERYPVRVRYAREDRDSVEALHRTLIPTPSGEHIPLAQLAHIAYTPGPQTIRSEDTFLTSYVLFDRTPDLSEVEVVDRARDHIAAALAGNQITLPTGVSFTFAGSYQSQIRSEQRLAILVPIALALVFAFLYGQFRSLRISAIIGSGVLVAVSGAFAVLWLWGQPWFLQIGDGGTLRDLLHVGPIHLSVGVWVGVIALIGLATDDGVVMATYLKQRLDSDPPQDEHQLKQMILEAGQRRVRPCLMTTTTTLLALLPVLMSDGRGADIMLPMALPIAGGMAIELMTLFVVPVAWMAFMSPAASPTAVHID